MWSNVLLELFDGHFHLRELSVIVDRALASARKREKSVKEPLRKTA